MTRRAIGRCLTLGVMLGLIANASVLHAKGDLDRFELVGSVNTVVTKHPQLKTIHRFDRHGHLRELELFPTMEAASARYRYLYDWDGELLEEQSYESNGALAYRKIFRSGLDERGRRSVQIAVTDTGVFAHAEFSFYDANDLLAEELLITGQGVAEKSLFDVRGNVIYHARYFQGRLVLETTHHHGPLGRLEESRFYTSDVVLMRKDLYRYDQAGHRTEQISEFHSRQSHLRTSVVTYEFDQAGNWTKETVQRWFDKNEVASPAETVVSRERTVSYYETGR